jgi:hypothetical protein
MVGFLVTDPPIRYWRAAEKSFAVLAFQKGWSISAPLNPEYVLAAYRLVLHVYFSLTVNDVMRRFPVQIFDKPTQFRDSGHPHIRDRYTPPVLREYKDKVCGVASVSVRRIWGLWCNSRLLRS